MTAPVTTTERAPALLFDARTGMISGRFREQCELVGIVAQQCFKNYGKWHVMNMDQVLQINGCYQEDWDIYKKGELTGFKITFWQAVAFLNDEYRDREIVMPRSKERSDAIFQCGTEATMRKHFYSFVESWNQGYRYDAIHFIVKDAAAQEEVKALLAGEYKEYFEGIRINIVIAGTDNNIFEIGLQKLSSSGELGDKYVIITNSTLAPKVELIATSAIENSQCLGIACAPITDWCADMRLYGYEEALGSHEKATIAWAASAWNSKARQTHTEFEAFLKSRDLFSV